MWIIASAAVIGQFLNLWYIGKGRILYPLVFATYLLYAIVETWLGLRDPTQRAVLLFNLVNLWGMSMAVKGWRATRISQASADE